MRRFWRWISRTAGALRHLADDMDAAIRFGKEAVRIMQDTDRTIGEHAAASEDFKAAVAREMHELRDQRRRMEKKIEHLERTLDEMRRMEQKGLGL